MTHNELIAALEAVDGPSRKLDTEIARHAGWHRVEPQHSGGRRGGWIAPVDFRGVCADGSPILDSLHGTTIYRDPPCFTYSLDASETLRLPGFVISVTQTAKQTRQVFKVVVEDATADVWAFGEHKHEAIARCIAWLKARHQ